MPVRGPFCMPIRGPDCMPFDTVLASPFHPRLDPPLNDRALELGEDPEHLEEGAPGWGGCVDRLPLKIEITPDRV